MAMISLSAAKRPIVKSVALNIARGIAYERILGIKSRTSLLIKVKLTPLLTTRLTKLTMLPINMIKIRIARDKIKGQNNSFNRCDRVFGGALA